MLYLPSLPCWKPYSRDLQKHLFLMFQNCKSMAQLSQLHANLVVNGFVGKNVLATKIISFCIASGNVTYASLVFNQVEKPNTTLCNQIIRAMYRGNMPGSSLGIYNRMRRGARVDLPQPNSYTYAFLLAACAKGGPNFLSQGKQLHCRVVLDGFCSSMYVLTNLINMYAASATSIDCIAKAYRIFEEMPQRSIVSWNSMLSGFLRCTDMLSAFRFFNDMPAKDKVSWTIMITGCAQAGRISESLDLFKQMRKACVKLDHVTITGVLSACADLGDLELGRCIHGLCYRILQLTDCMVNTSNSLVHMYVKCGAIDDAFQVFTEIHFKSTASWTIMIAGLATHGYCDGALDLFQRLLQGAENEKPDWLTFIAVFCACSYVGRINEGLCYFEQMISAYGIQPRIEHYGCMVDMLCRAGQLSQAQEMIRKMPMKPNYAIWGALLGGCFMHKDEKLASLVINKVMELEPEKVSGHFVSVSNLYAAAAKWGNSQLFREMMLDRSIIKPMASSLLYVNGTSINHF